MRDTPSDLDLAGLFEKNTRWAASMEQRDPGFFSRLLTQQTPQYLWIGCADSRVPANELVGLLPATCSCIATWPTSWRTPISTRCR